MKDLMVSELRRFRWLALVAGTAHLLLLLFLNRLGDLLHGSYFDGLLLLIYIATGLALAIAQVGSYRKPSQWMWLIHRPLAPWRIFGALSLSALLLLTVAVLVPLLVLAVGLESLTTRVVDLRHYFTVLHALAFTMMAWLAGAHACVSRSRAAVAVLFAPLLLALHMVSVLDLILPVSLALAWLGWITLRSFRANRDAPVRGIPTLLATALPLQVGLFLLCVIVFRFLFVSASILLGVDPLNTEHPPQGGLIATERAEPSEEIALGLAHSDHPRSQLWRDQMPLLDALRIDPDLARFPVRHQLSNLELPNGWYDAERSVAWQFSHDDMLFHGRHPKSGARRGVFGRGGEGDATPFEAVPVVLENGDLMTPNALLGVEQDRQAVSLRLVLDEGERFTAVPRWQFNRVLLLTNERLIAMREDRRAAAGIPPLRHDWAIDLPRGSQHLTFATVVELMDGWLVSFVYGSGFRQVGAVQFNVVRQPWQQIVHVDGDGTARPVAERRIERDFPAVQVSDWWLSPPLKVLTTLPQVLLDKGFTRPMTLGLLPGASALYVAALSTLLLSAGVGWWWLHGTRASGTRRRVWLASCALLGLPALLSLFLLEPRKVRT